MGKILHGVCAGLLLIAHLGFITRGFILARGGGKPQGFDRVARFAAQALLPLTAATGFFAQGSRGIPFFPHPLAGLLPLASIPLVSAGRILLRKGRELPWLLPLLNLFLILVAQGTGLARLLLDNPRPGN